jgi:exosortase/archaeosortase family protein
MIEKRPKMSKIEKKKRPIIEFEGKKYEFSIKSILLLVIGAPLLSFLIYLFFDMEMNYWLHEIVVKQTSYFLNLFFNMGSEAIYAPGGQYHWLFQIPGKYPIYFETFCTGIQAICVFAGIIICTPHSKDRDTSEDIIWRKSKSLIISSLLFYVVNIIRMLIQLYLYYIGYEWVDIHYSISAASSFIAAIIILLLHKWMPEFIISIIYTGTLISEPIKLKRKELLKDTVEETNEIDLNLIRKVVGMDRKTFIAKFPERAEVYGFTLEENSLIIPDNKKEVFLEAIEKKFEKKTIEKEK